MDSAFLGMVQYFAFDWAPRTYLLCNGALLSIASNSALFSLLGTQYGGDGRTTFALPDLRGRSVIGQSTTYTMGETVGSPTATLLTSNMPSHTHIVPNTAQTSAFLGGRGASGDNNIPTGAFAANPSAGKMYTATAGRGEFLGTPSVTVGIAGSGVPFSVQNPYLAVTATICTAGIFPSRN